jgi:hypothetical protein
MGLFTRKTNNLFLHQQNQRNNENKKKNAQMEEDEETLSYKPFQRSTFLNDEPGVFGSSAFDESKSINKAPNIFDATAVFHVKREE